MVGINFSICGVICKLLSSKVKDRRKSLTMSHVMYSYIIIIECVVLEVKIKEVCNCMLEKKWGSKAEPIAARGLWGSEAKPPALGNFCKLLYKLMYL